MNYYIRAYDKHNHEILGNCDGQTVLFGIKNYRQTAHYRRLRQFPSLNNRIKYYKIFTENGTYLETVYNELYIGD